MFFIKRLMWTYQTLLRATSGATAIEYGLIVAGIALGIIAALFLTGDVLHLVFSDIATKMGSARAQAGV